jgi:hypothetical protein
MLRLSCCLTVDVDFLNSFLAISTPTLITNEAALTTNINMESIRGEHESL